MKLGIITFHRAKNYGAVLQAYALNKATQNLNIDSDIIDYRENKIENDYIFFKNKKPKKFLKDVLNYPLKIKKWKKFDNFIEKNISLSDKCTNEEELRRISEKYDCFITGSDQVFNLKMTGNDRNYFLDFVSDDKKKNSYAASFGQKIIPKEQKNIYHDLLVKFNNISIRENDAINIVDTLVQREARIDIDPSFLIDKEQWKCIAKEPKEKNYILLFTMQQNSTIFNFAEKLSEKTGYKIIFITDGYKKRLKAIHKTNIGPEEWIGYFLNAKYVITNSFHGLSFSINFNKDFFVELQKPPATGNSRLETLIDEYGLRERLVENGENSNIDKKIDWEKVNEKLERNKKKSLDYLKGLKNE